MSIDTKNALYAALKADSALVALLAVDPNVAPAQNEPPEPAIFLGSHSQAPPVYPSITYRITAGTPDKRFRPPLNEGGPSPVQDEYLSLEVWSNNQDSAIIEQIAARLIAIFDGQALALTTGIIYRAELVTSAPDCYDPNFKVYFGLYQFRFRIALS